MIIPNSLIPKAGHKDVNINVGGCGVCIIAE